jgi:NAD-dependent dihydropyrimidine dehydrogenase PreA subunit
MEMELTDEEIYRRFIEYVSNPLLGFPESEHKWPMIKSFITPEEADFMTGFPMSPTSLEKIAAQMEMDPEEAFKKIDTLCKKGLVYEAVGASGDSLGYRLFLSGEMFLRIPFWDGKDKEPKKSMAPHASKYYMDGFYSQLKTFPHPRLRAIPIDKTVEDTRAFLPFEDVLKIIDDYEYYTVSYCPCRERHRLDPDYEDSKFPAEVCLHFDELGRYIVKHGHGREITKQETLEILKQAADAGLVHGLGNYQGQPDTLCNCDIEYCTFFKPYHQLGFDQSMAKSNYLAQSNPLTCTACGSCVKRCPMDAIEMKFNPESTNKFRKAVVVNTDICIGCGVCVHKCKPKSLTLKRKEEETITWPPKTYEDNVMQNAAMVLAAREKQK